MNIANQTRETNNIVLFLCGFLQRHPPERPLSQSFKFFSLFFLNVFDVEHTDANLAVGPIEISFNLNFLI